MNHPTPPQPKPNRPNTGTPVRPDIGREHEEPTEKSPNTPKPDTIPDKK